MGTVARAYAVHPAVAHVAKIAANLPQTTGRTLQEWLLLLAKFKLADAKSIVAKLKAEHGLGMVTANLIAEAATAGAESLSADAYLHAAPGYVDALFAPPKQALRPLYEMLLDAALDLGADIQLSPCKTFVPLYRKHVFAQLKPSTRTRLDLGLALGAMPAQGRLIDTGGYAKKDRITHRIAIGAEADIDRETLDWLRRAYEADKP
jgi:hypothetical protein